jgi:hypothetical protein
MKKDETEQTKTGSWPEIRSVGEDIDENTEDENSQESSPESEEED